MFSLKSEILFIVYSVLVICESSFLDSLTQCRINDGECQRDLYERVLRDIGKTGVEELKIPPIDPIELQNVTVSVLGLVDLTLVDGIATGVKNCKFISFKTVIEDGRTSMDLLCDINVKGHYTAFSNSPLIKSLLGENSIQGDGYAKIKIEQLNLKIDYEYNVKRLDDGEIYMKCRNNKTKYTYKVLGRSNFQIDNLFVGSADMSHFITDFLNQNGKMVMNTFGGPFMDKAMEFFYVFTLRFFDTVPAKYYISDDLTSYLKD